MGMSVGGGGSVKAEPNVVPMIDIMLVLLIIFMLVIPAVSAGFQAVPPQGQNLKPHPEEDTDQVLGIDATGQYYLNRAPIPAAELPQRLRAIFEGRELDRLLYVKAHQELEYSKILDALDIAAKNEVRVAGMITDQTPGTQSLVAADNLLQTQPAEPPPGGQE